MSASLSGRSFLLPLLFSALALPAQEAPAASPAQKRPDPVVINTSFAGGTMAEFVARLRAEEPRANIIVAAAAAGAKVPPVELRGAGLELALEGACAVAAAEMQVRVATFKGAGEPIYSIIAIPVTPVGGANAKPEVATQVYSLNRLTEEAEDKHGRMGFKVETILSAIEAGQAGDEPAPVLRYHRESGLLIARGTRSQLGLVKDVLSNLERDVEARRQQRNAERGIVTTNTPFSPPAPAADETKKKDK